MSCLALGRLAQLKLLGRHSHPRLTPQTPRTAAPPPPPSGVSHCVPNQLTTAPSGRQPICSRTENKPQLTKLSGPDGRSELYEAPSTLGAQISHDSVILIDADRGTVGPAAILKATFADSLSIDSVRFGNRPERGCVWLDDGGSVAVSIDAVSRKDAGRFRDPPGPFSGDLLPEEGGGGRERSIQVCRRPACHHPGPLGLFSESGNPGSSSSQGDRVSLAGREGFQPDPVSTNVSYSQYFCSIELFSQCQF